MAVRNMVVELKDELVDCGNTSSTLFLQVPLYISGSKVTL